jgi:hypothetical protein
MHGYDARATTRNVCYVPTYVVGLNRRQWGRSCAAAGNLREISETANTVKPAAAQGV